jgi:hypothetical protein
MLTRKNLEKLCKNCDFNPTDVGLAILKLLNYKVEQYRLSGALYVLTKDGKHILYFDSGAYVD